MLKSDKNRTILIDQLYYRDLPDSVKYGVMLEANKARQIDGEALSVTSSGQSSGLLRARHTQKRKISLSWAEGMTDTDMFDHLGVLYANQRSFVFQYDVLFSRNVASCQFVDQQCTKWAAPHWPIVPYNHTGEAAYDWSDHVLVNNRRYTGPYTVDATQGVIEFEQGAVDVNSRVQIRYDFRMLVRIDTLTCAQEIVTGSVRTVDIVLAEVGPAAYDCGPFEVLGNSC